MNALGTGIEIKVWPGGLQSRDQANKAIEAAQRECALAALLFEPVFGESNAELEAKGRKPKPKGSGKGKY